MSKSKEYSKLILPSLVFSRFAIQPPTILLSLLMIDIGLSFGVSVGVMGQISTVASIASFLTALVMGALSIRYSHKNLLLTGLGLRVIAAIGCIYANSYMVLMAMYVLNGFGTAFVAPMTMALAAHHLPKEKRSEAVGWIITGMALSYVIGSIGINYLSNLGGWRVPIYSFILPISLLSFASAFFFIPETLTSNPREGAQSVLGGFKVVFTHRSAVACLFGLMFMSAAFSCVGTYAASFFRQIYGVSTTFASFMFMGSAIMYGVGSQVAGRLINRFGNRRVWIATILVSAVGMIVALLGLNVWLSLFTAVSGYLLLGMTFTAANGLTLVQVPEYRGTLMSLFSAANSLGTAVGTALGGAILLFSGYRFLGFGIGLLCVFSVITVYTSAVEDLST